jgi:ABC-type uncharacterized transport system involved in gliding motility auxiliary subunit
MELNRKTRTALALHHWVFIVLLLALAGLLLATTRIYHANWDLSFNARNSLSAGSSEFLKKLPGPVDITAYASPKSEVAKSIRDFLTPYQRAKADIRPSFVDPSEQPQLARAAGIQMNGELVVDYAKRSEHLTTLNESSLTNLLMRLARDQERRVMYLDGHGERKLDGQANFDLGDFGAQLANRGFRIAPLKLTLAQEVPHNISMLVIASPRVDLLPTEVDKLKAYLKRGGNLLWLIDQEPLRGMQPIAEELGLVLTPGTIIDPEAQQMNASATMAIGAAYARHPLIGNLDVITLFPLARQIGVLENHGDWQATPLVEVAARGWVEQGALDGPIAFDKGKDMAGPVGVAAVFERSVDNKAQRVVVVGSGGFLANQFLGNGGNLDLGVNMVNWLAGDESLITIQPRATKDANLQLSRTSLTLIAVGWMIALPIALLAGGGLIWWRRRTL